MSLKHRRVCATREWKRRNSLATARLDPVGGTAAGRATFTGRVYLANLTFEGAGGPWSVLPSDVDAVLDYLQHAVPPIESYAGQYGPTKVSVGSSALPLTVPTSSGKYSDRELQGWVKQLADSGGLGPGSAIMVLNPSGPVNTDATESGGVGVLGYHGLGELPYGFVNLLGSGFTRDDSRDLFAEALSHEVAELVVDPQADGSNPEVCDGCGTNCLGSAAYRSYFDAAGGYMGSASSLPPPFAYDFFISAIAKPAAAAHCPAPASACAYPPP